MKAIARALRMATLLAASTLVSLRAQAAIVLGGDGGDGFTSGTTTLSFPATVADGVDRFALLTVTTGQGAARVSAARLGTTAFAFIAGTDAPGGGCRIEWWGLAAPAVGTANVTIDLPTAASYVDARLLPYQGVSAVRPLTGVATATGSAGSVSVTVNGATPADLALDGVCTSGADSHLAIAGPDQTGRWHWSTGALSSAGSERAGAPSVTLTWTTDGPGDARWAVAGLALQATATGGSYPVHADLDIGGTGCSVAARGAKPGPATLLVISLMALGWGCRRKTRQRR